GAGACLSSWRQARSPGFKMMHLEAGMPGPTPTTNGSRRGSADPCPARGRPAPVLHRSQGRNPMLRLTRSRFALLGLAILVVFALVPPGPADAQKKVLNIAAKEPETLDPHTSILGQTQAIKRFMYRGLTRFAIKGGKVITSEVEPDLAESWTASSDGTVWTFKL